MVIILRLGICRSKNIQNWKYACQFAHEKSKIFIHKCDICNKSNIKIEKKTFVIRSHVQIMFSSNFRWIMVKIDLIDNIIIKLKNVFAVDGIS